jgi:hypothetical protein
MSIILQDVSRHFATTTTHWSHIKISISDLLQKYLTAHS